MTELAGSVNRSATFQPHWLPTTIGSLPYTSSEDACRTVLRFTPDIPAWPQLPKRSPLENMYAQFMERFPGAESTDGTVRVSFDDPFQSGLERLYLDYVEGNADRYLPSAARALGLSAMLRALHDAPRPPVAAKGQVTGPISIGLQVTDQDRKPLLYDEIALDAVAKHLRLVAQAQERALRRVAPYTIIFVDEPYLNAYGSALVSLSKEQVVAGLEEVFGGLAGLKGVHCCGNTDWSVVLSTSVDILNFDAYQYAETLALYPEHVDAFLRRGGILAWGIVPSNEHLLANENISSLIARLLAGIDLLVGKGVPRQLIVAQSLVMPSCGLGSLSTDAAERALELLAEVSRQMRSRAV